MPALTLELENVRCFERLRLSFDGQVTVLLGENGAGKTTVVEALASVSWGEGEGLERFPLRRGAASGRVALYEGKQARATWVSSGGRRRLAEHDYLFAYGRYRRVYIAPAKPDVGFEVLGAEWDDVLRTPTVEDLRAAAQRRRTASLTAPDNHLLRDLGGYLLLIDARRRHQPEMERAWQRLSAGLRLLGEGLEGMEARDIDGRPEVVFLRQGVPLRLSELSDGYQSVLVVVLDLVLRYTQIFKGRDDPLAGEATVVVDEVDLHLHPRWQRLVVRQLTELFPGTRFILTTHSAAVVQGAVDAGHDVVVLCSEGGVARARRLTPRERKRVRGAQIGSVLVERALFDVGSRFSLEYAELEVRAERLRGEVERGGGDTATRRELLEVLEKLEELAADDEKRRGAGGPLAEIGRTQMAFLRQLEAELEKADGSA